LPELLEPEPVMEAATLLEHLPAMQVLHDALVLHEVMHLPRRRRLRRLDLDPRWLPLDHAITVCPSSSSAAASARRASSSRRSHSPTGNRGRSTTPSLHVERASISPRSTRPKRSSIVSTRARNRSTVTNPPANPPANSGSPPRPCKARARSNTNLSMPTPLPTATPLEDTLGEGTPSHPSRAT